MQVRMTPILQKRTNCFKGVHVSKKGGYETLQGITLRQSCDETVRRTYGILPWPYVVLGDAETAGSTYKQHSLPGEG